MSISASVKSFAQFRASKLRDFARLGFSRAGRPAPMPEPEPDPYDAVRLTWKTPGELEDLVRTMTRAEIDRRFGDDAWLRNYMLSFWEYVNRCYELESYPWNMTLGITSTCNAKCTFCSVPLRRSKHPALASDLDTIPHLKHLLKYTRLLLITGGEPTIHPRFGQMLAQLKDILDPRAYVTMITHGHRLKKFEAELAALNVNFVVSFNAATPATHHKLMRLGEDALPQIVESVRWARQLGRMVDLSFVVVRDNIHEIPEFIRLAEELGCHGVYLRTLIPGDYYAAMFPNKEEFLGLPAWSHPQCAYWQDQAREAIAKTSINVYGDPDQWHVRLQSADLPPNTEYKALLDSQRNDPPIVMTKGDPLPAGSTHDDWRQPVANSYNRLAPFACSYPWYALKILDSSERIYPCSFIHHIMGHDDVGLHGSENFFDLWNSAAMVHLRRTLEEGPLLPECITCPSQMGGEGQCQSDRKAKPESALA